MCMYVGTCNASKKKKDLSLLSSMACKRAVIIGIDYLTDAGSRLFGCVNDAKTCYQNLQKHFDFAPEDLILLVDVPETPGFTALPTRANIIRYLKECSFLSHRTALSPFWFSYAGHGGAIPDKNQDEKDGQDECFMPMDYKTTGVILDDEIHTILASFHKQSRIMGLIDACHSGSLFDLPYQSTYESSGLKHWTNQQTVWSGPEVLLLSACQDQELASETVTAESKPGGAMTTTFWTVIEAQKEQTMYCSMLLTALRATLIKNGFKKQWPQLSATVPLVKAAFMMPYMERPWLCHK